MSSIIFQIDKKTGAKYAFESISYWDKDKKQPRSKRKYAHWWSRIEMYDGVWDRQELLFKIKLLKDRVDAFESGEKYVRYGEAP